MRVDHLSIPDVLLITPQRLSDPRGFFSEAYNRRDLAKAGIEVEFVQDNESLSWCRGTLRGIHFQKPPFAQDKLVRCVAGTILDVAVDLRRSSPTFGRYVSAVLSAENGAQLFVPIGFGHAFLTLEDNCRVLYKTSEHYAPDHEAGVRWDDPEIGIDWGLEASHVILSDKDRDLPVLQELVELF